MENGEDQAKTLVSAAERVLPKDAEKWDKDIHTLVALNKDAKKRRYSFVVTGGIAVEAHCGGRISRPHADINIILGRPSTMFSVDDEAENIQSVLSRESERWGKKVAGKKIKFLEINDKLSRKKDWRDRRRVEVQVVDALPEGQAQAKKLVDSQGNIYEFQVEEINLLTANKIVSIFSELQYPPEKYIGKFKDEYPQRFDELRRLMEQDDYNEDDCFIKMARRYASQSSRKEANEKAGQQLGDISRILGFV